MSTPKNTLPSIKEGSILKSSLVSKKKPIGSTHVYFRPKSNLKPKNQRGIFRTMVFKNYLQLSLHTSIQNVNEFGSIEIKALEAMTSIWKILTAIDRYIVILAWQPKTENIIRPLNTIDLAKIVTKKVVNCKTIELLQMGWFTSNTNVRFRLGHNQLIVSMLEDPNLSYILDNH